MKLKILSLFFCLLILSGNFMQAQSGSRLILRAESQYLKGHYKRSLRLLKKAEKADYGWCGNAYFDAIIEIEELQIKSLIGLEEYEKSREVLNSISTGGLGAGFFERGLDSLEVLSYQLEYGRDSLRGMFMQGLLNVRIETDNEDFRSKTFAIIPLQNGKEMRLRIDTKKNPGFLQGRNDEDWAKSWKDEFYQSKRYQWIVFPSEN